MNHETNKYLETLGPFGSHLIAFVSIIGLAASFMTCAETLGWKLFAACFLLICVVWTCLLFFAKKPSDFDPSVLMPRYPDRRTRLIAACFTVAAVFPAGYAAYDALQPDQATQGSTDENGIQPASTAIYEVPENTTVTYGEPSPMGPKPGTYYIEGTLQIEVHSQTATQVKWKTIVYSLAMGRLPKWNYQGDHAIILESAPYPNIRKHEPTFSLIVGPDPLATLTTTKGGEWELHGLIGERTGKGLHGGDTDATALIAAGTFTGPYTNPTSFTVTRGYRGRTSLGPSFNEGLGTPPLSFAKSTLRQPLARSPFDP